MTRVKGISKARLVVLASVIVTVILGIQLVAATAWTADGATRGPEIVIIQMS